MAAITEFFTELFELISLLWNLKTLIIVGVVILVLFLFYERVIGVVAHHKEVFGKGDKKND